MRVEHIGDATLMLGDCRTILPTLGRVDHVICDPPYEDELHAKMGGFSKLRNDGAQYPSVTSGTLDFAGINSIRDLVAADCVAVSQGWVILFSLAEGVRAWRDALQAAGAKYDTCIAWIKPDSAPRFNGQGAARGFECAVTAWAGKGHKNWNAGGKRGVYTHCTNPPDRHGAHPTEKPWRLMAELISDFTQPGQVICDPFAGSGSTGVACAKLGRKFIGIELEPKYFDIACRRIEEAYRQPRLDLGEPASKPTQLPLAEGF